MYQRSLEHLTTLCMTSVYFHFLSLSLYHFFFSIVYNRGARLPLTCLDTPSWLQHLVNENVECSLYARAGRKVKNTRVGVQLFFLEEPEAKKQQSNYF